MSFDFDDFDVRGRFFDLEEKTEQLGELMSRMPVDERCDFEEMCTIAYIYHDCALDGVVVTYQELRAVCDRKVASASSLIPLYQEIKNHRDAFQVIWEGADKSGRNKRTKREPITSESVIEMHRLFLRDLARKTPGVLRKDMPLHRTYFHELTEPDEIAERLEGVSAMTADSDFQAQHPINQASLFHHAFMKVFPFTEGSGQVGRLFMNQFLMKGGYKPAVIHGSDRQRYYEALKVGPAALRLLILDSMDAGLDAQHKFLREQLMTRPVQGRALRSGTRY
jgi:Fic family protein